MPASPLRVIGARSHNLRGIDVDLPHGQLIGICGLSGSGKSTLVHDTILREARRRFQRAVFLGHRDAVEELEPAAVDRIEGLRPALGLGARVTRPSSRSTVGTIAELHESWRLLFGRRGVPHCPACDRIASTTSPDVLRDEILACAAGRKTVLLAPLVHERLEEPAWRTLFARLLDDGFLRVRIDGQIEPLEPLPLVDPVSSHRLEVVVDRLVPGPDRSARLLEAVERAVALGDGRVIASVEEVGDLEFTTLRSCAACGAMLEPLTPTLFRIGRRSACADCVDRPAVEECTTCSSTGLGAQALATRWNGRGAREVFTLEFGELLPWFRELSVDHADRRVLAPLIEDLERRMALLVDLGLHYLTCARRAATLSGGELMRVRIAQLLGARLRDALYVLDEPTVGLHPGDTSRVVRALRRLSDQGNTVIVVEHDPGVLRACDHVVEIGPGAAAEGGRVVFAGTPDALQRHAGSPTGPYLGDSQTGCGASTRTRRSLEEGRFVALTGARGRNLKNVSLHVPLRVLTGFAGVSGSGKSSLVIDTFVPALRRALDQNASRDGLPHDGLTGTESLRAIVVIDQSPFGVGARSCLATFTKLWNDVRELFATTQEARMRGFTRARFSMNVARARGGGRCEACRGAGVTVVDLAGLPPLTATCDACSGARFADDTLAVRFAGRNVAEVLDGTVDEARSLFAFHPRIARVLQSLADLGLGYLSLGRPAATLSGGEAQRVKIAVELARNQTDHTVYVLDEPTRGLHPRDVDGLVEALQRLVDGGHTVWFVEHDPRVLAACDHLVTLGPGGGREGGCIVAQGAPAISVRSIAADDADATIDADADADAKERAVASIELRGVHTKDLRGLDVDVVRGRLTTVGGPGGAGKTALVIDTVYREARRRLAELVSPDVVRTLASSLAAPVDRIAGLGPVLATSVDDHEGAMQKGRTIGDVLDLLRPLRALFALRATPMCPHCQDQPLEHFTAARIARHACATWSGEKAWILAPFYEPGSCAESAHEFLLRRREALVSQGWIRVFAAGREWRIDTAELEEGFPEDAAFDVVIDRVAFQDASEPRLLEALDGALVLGRSTARIARRSTPNDPTTYLRTPRCGRCGFTWPAELALQDFSRTARRGACPTCRGSQRNERLESCSACAGTGLGPIGRGARLLETSLPTILSETLQQLFNRLASWRNELGATTSDAGRGVATERALDALAGVIAPALDPFDLGHLALDRTLEHLSASELSALQLLACCAPRLDALTFAWDDPTRGLDGAGRERIARWMRTAVEAGHTALVATNDPAICAQADQRLFLGPGDGKGGTLCDDESPRDAASGAVGRSRAPECVRFDLPSSERWSATSLELAFGRVTRLVGKAHIGKTRFLRDRLLPSAREHFGSHGAFHVFDTPSEDRTVAAATALDERIARTWARIPEAVRGGYDARSFLLRGSRPRGACPACRGRGVERVALDFLGELNVPCERCAGACFAPDVLAIRDRGRTLHEVFSMTVDEARTHWSEVPDIRERLDRLHAWHLGHVVLGRPLRELSTMERRWFALAELERRVDRRSVLAFDFPFQTAHERDRVRYRVALATFAERGHAVIVTDDDRRPLLDDVTTWTIRSSQHGRITVHPTDAQGDPRVATNVLGPLSSRGR